MFNLDEEESIRRSSISKRLSIINSDYFKQVYDCIYEQFSDLHSSANQLQHNLILVDSSIVSDTAGKLQEGIYSNQSGKKAVKYSVVFDGILPCCSNAFTSASYSSEDVALPEVVMNHVKQETGHHNIYVLDKRRFKMEIRDLVIALISCEIRWRSRFILWWNKKKWSEFSSDHSCEISLLFIS